MSAEQTEWTADDCDLGQLESYASINCRYYIKRLAELTEPLYAAERVALCNSLAEWADLHRRLRDDEMTLEHARECAKAIEDEELKPPKLHLLEEAQEDENEALWGKGIRTYEQVLWEQARREAMK